MTEASVSSNSSVSNWSSGSSDDVHNPFPVDQAIELSEIEILGHGWAGISAVAGEDWQSQCRGLKEEDAKLCTQCKRLEKDLSAGLEGQLSEQMLRLDLGTRDHIRERGLCYCCRSFLWLMEKYNAPPDSTVCVRLENMGHSDLAMNVAFIPPSVESQGRHDGDQKNLEFDLCLRPLTSRFGREAHVRSYDPHRVNLDRIRTWINHCEENHVGACQSGHFVPLESEELVSDTLKEILLVDLEQECVVTASFESRYVALSYVWGTGLGALTTTKNLDALRKPGSLSRDNVSFQLPPTIRDAMSLSRSLGEKLIWIDSLCIIQDGGALKQRFLQAMAFIYANAYFTIVAAAGNGADYGIRGVGADSTDRDVPCHILDFPLSPMMVQRENATRAYPEESKWASRGWTFQESIFSRRLLIMDDLATWICGKAIAFEHFEDHFKRSWMFYRPESINLHNSTVKLEDISSLSYLIDSYNSRDLTYESDVINAFAGITTVALQAFPRGIHHGIPVASFEICLLWQVDGQMRPRLGVDGAPLPSWSWLGSAGSLNFTIWYASSHATKYADSQQFVIEPLVEWHTFTLPPSNQDTYGNDPAENTSQWVPDQYIKSAENLERSVMPTTHANDDEPVKNMPSSPISFAEHTLTNPLSAGSPYLHFHTTLARLHIGRVPPPTKIKRDGKMVMATTVIIPFINAAGQAIGAMRLPISESQEVTRIKDLELVAISSGKLKTHPGYHTPDSPLDDGSWTLWEWYEGSGEDMPGVEWLEFCNVLWVEWRDGVVYRKGLGRVIRPAWEKLDLEVRDVVLG